MVESFPDLAGKGWPIKRSPNFTTLRYETLSGRRTYAPKQTYPRWQWEIPYNFLRSAAYGGTATFSELETLLAFFNARSSDGMVFKYTDQEDNTATDQGFGSGDGVTTEFQLYRAYGGFSEPIYSAAPSSVMIDGVDTPDFTLGDLGVITFLVAPSAGAALTWTGTFDFLCRFDDDALGIDNIMPGLHVGSGGVRFSSELNP